MKRWRKEVSPPQAPEHRAFQPGENAGEEDRRGGVVGELATARHVVQRTGCNAISRQTPVDRVNPERENRMTNADALDLRDLGAQAVEKLGSRHSIERLRSRECVPHLFLCWRVSQGVRADDVERPW